MSEFEAFKGNRNWVAGRPRDPKCADLGVIDLELVHGEGVLKGSPNVMAVFAHRVPLTALLSGQIKFKVLGVIPADKDSTLLDLLPVEGRDSIISGRPALVYRSNEAEIALAPDEMERFISRTLTPEEFTAICGSIGAVYEMHDDFYNPETGASWALMELEDDDEVAPQP